MPGIRKKIIKIYSFILLIGLAYYIWLELTGIYIPCTVYATTGFRCCGCGITNMFVAMAHFDFAAAFWHNPVMFVLFFFWNLVAMLVFWGKPAFLRKEKFLYILLWITVAVSCAYWFLRNL